MKKLILMAFFIIPTLLFAQDDQEKNEFKPEVGQKTLELQLTPLGNSPISINGLRYRSFVSSQQAFRLNVNLSYNLNSNIIQQADPNNDDLELKSKTSSILINISPGMEYHLKGTDRLSLYYGYQGSLAFRTSSVKNELQNGFQVYYLKTTNNNPLGYFSLGASVLAGLDFYITKKLYIGTEMSFGATYYNYLSSRTTSDLPNFTEPEPQKNGGGFNIGLNANSQIRLGVVF